MAQDPSSPNDETPGARRSRTRAWTWPPAWPVGRPAAAAGGTPAEWNWPRWVVLCRQQVGAWAIEEASAGRLLPWFAVAFGAGIVIYFSADREPQWWAPCVLAAALAAVTIAVRARPVGFVLCLGGFAVAAGFAVATLKTALISHPVLRGPVSGISVTGFVELREESQHTDRFVLRVDHVDAARNADWPDRIRLSVKRGTAPPAGAFIAAKAQLEPPLQPLEPGSYDFARDLYFQRIGASGFVRGPVAITTAPRSDGLFAKADALVQNLRDAIDQRIRSVVGGDPGAIASMLITGRRDAIAPHLFDALFVSGVGHVLSISGYHMAVVAGLVFFALRALLALVPGLAERAPIKKWAAGAALAVTSFYLLLSGAEVATQRSFVMIAIVLIGVLLDRPTLTMRTLTIAALLVLLFAPQAVVHPSFQMSFAATLALIAGYERGSIRIAAGPESSLGARAALWGVNEMIALAAASFLAGLATTPYAAYHFHRVAPFGVIANLLSMPVVSGWVMPMGILGILAMPFGLDAECWRQMGYGLEWMNAVSLWVAGLPGAYGRMAAFGAGPLIVMTLGLLLIGLLKTPLRWSGLIVAALGIVAALRTPAPDVLIAGDGRSFALRGDDGRLSIHRGGSDSFAVREWLAADADGRDVHDGGLGKALRCDPLGCVGRLADGSLVAYAITPDALEEDCRRAVLVVSLYEPPPDCAAQVVTRRDWRAGGALALRREAGGGFGIEGTRWATYDRPWAPARRSVVRQSEAGGSGGEAATNKARPARDATPAAADIDAEE